jgi:hypothetical protein
MIICTQKTVEVNKLDRHYITFFLYKDNEKTVTNIGFSKLYSDLGVIVLLIVKDAVEMNIVKKAVEEDKTLNVLFIYSENSMNRVFKNSNVEFIKTDEPLHNVINKHIKDNTFMYDNITSNYEFVSGLSKNKKEYSTLHTENIITIYKDRFSENDKNYLYYLEIDIETSDDVKRIFKNYISSIDKKQSESLYLKGLLTASSVGDITEKLYIIMSLVK